MAMMENTAQSGGKIESSTEAYKAFIDSAFPFAAKGRDVSDKKMVEFMKKEADKGPIKFDPVATPNPLARAVKTMQVPDEFKRKLQDRVRARNKRCT